MVSGPTDLGASGHGGAVLFLFLLMGIFGAKVFPYILIGAVIHNWIPAE